MYRNPSAARRRRRSLALAGAIGVFATPAAVVPAAAADSQPACQPGITRLPDLGFGSEVDAHHGNTFVGSVLTDAAGGQMPAIWRDGHLIVLGGVASPGWAGDINRRGDIVGSADSGAFIYRDGTLQMLPTGGSGFAYARRINDRGQIAGAAFDGRFAARWDSSTSDPVALLPAPGDTFSFAKGINDAGIVAGDSDDANGVPHAAVWSATGGVRLLAPAFGAGQPGVLYAINRPGETVGDSYLTDPAGIILADQATAWSAGGDPSLIPFLPGTNQSVALEVSDRGWVVGGAAEADYDTGSLSPTHAFLWLGDGPAETLPVPGLSYADSQSLAHGVDSQGTVVGSSGPVDGTASATVWTCARELAYTPASASTARTAIPTHTPARPSRATRRGWRMPREHVGPISATNPPRW